MKDEKMTNDELKKRMAKLKENFESYEDVDTDNSELQDVVNSEDEVIGALPRGVIWDNGLQSNTRVVNVCVVNEEGRMLLQIRSMKKRNWPGGYDFSCGENLKSGESYEEAVYRGINEEIGLERREILEIREVGRFTPDKERGFACFGKVYMGRITKNADFDYDTNEIADLRWESIEKIRDLYEHNPEMFKGDFKSIFELAFYS